MTIKRLLIIAFLMTSVDARCQVGTLFTAGHQLPNSYVEQMVQDQYGFMWMATRNGVCRYDGYRFRQFHAEDKNANFSNNDTICLATRSDGRLMVGTNTGIDVYDGNTFTPICVTDRTGKSMPVRVNHLLRLKSGGTVACTSGHGLLWLGRGDTVRTGSGLPEEVKFSHQVVEDAKGHLWVRTENSGVVEMDGRRITGHYFAHMPGNDDPRHMAQDAQSCISHWNLGNSI